MINEDKLQILIDELDQIKKEMFKDISGTYKEVMDKVLLHSFKIAIIGELEYYNDMLKNLDTHSLTVATFKIAMLINEKVNEEYGLFNQVVEYWMKYDITTMDTNTVEEIILVVLNRD